MVSELISEPYTNDLEFLLTPRQLAASVDLIDPDTCSVNTNVHRSCRDVDVVADSLSGRQYVDNP